jgi:uncharacterized membrane protein YgaE (UPF0421/DUF939 family)
MKKTIIILTLVCAIFASCGDSQTATKEKELELKEQELKQKEESLLEDKKKEIELKEQELKQKEEALKSKSISKVQTKLRQPKGNYVIGIKDRVYFYASPDYDSQTSVYFVKGQKAKVVEIMDENLDNEFLHVNFEYKGKVTDGYILYEDIKFE